MVRPAHTPSPPSPLPKTAKTEGLRQEDLQLMIDLVDHARSQAFASATAEFKERPSALNWGRLIDAMHAHQYWQGLTEDRRKVVAREVTSEPIGSWIKRLRQMQTSAFDDADD